MPSVTLSSVGTSPAIALDYLAAKGTTFAVTASSSGTTSYSIQGTLDAPQLVASPTWFNISTAAVTATSSIYLWAGPLAGLRVNATAMSSMLLTLYALQNAGG
jgi:hypothetical protein